MIGLFQDEIVVDLFAGGGGASEGIEAAIGRPVDLAINHDAIALAVHKANHPQTKHLEADIWEVRPKEATEGRKVGLLWASPDCTHFSVAKGGKPRKQNIRSLAWVVTRWAADVRPRMIFLENVSEFRGWGPLGPDGQPDKSRMGETFRRWLRRLERLGYKVEYRVLDASAYGAPTRRRRLFLIARCDGQPIYWPEVTHGPVNPLTGKPANGLQPYRTAGECIDWSIPCPSIFERDRPLAEKTLWRIAQGIRRFVLENPKPFIVGVGGRAGQSHATPADAPVGTITAKNDRAVVEPVLAPALMKFRGDSAGASLDEPAPTITAGHGRPERPAGAGHALGLMVPTLVEMNHSNAPRGVDEPLGVVTTQHNRFNLVEAELAPVDAAPFAVKVNHGGQDARGESLEDPLTTVTATQRGHALIAPSLVKVNHGNDEKTGRREHSLEDPLGTVTAGGNGHALIAPTLIQTGYGERPGQAPRALDIQAPLGTAVAGGVKHAVIAAHLSRQFGQGVGSDPDEPAPTIMPGGQGKTALVSAFMAKHYGGVVGTQMDLPLGTITAVDHHSPVAATLVKLNGECHGSDLDEPMPTITAGGFHVGEVRAFLTAYYGTDGTEGKGQSLFEPMRTATTKARLGLVTVEGVEFQIVDIGMRMPEPHELLRAQFGRFAEAPKDGEDRLHRRAYDLSAARTKSAKVRLIGNSVCPEVAEAVVRGNLGQQVQEVRVA